MFLSTTYLCQSFCLLRKWLQFSSFKSNVHSNSCKEWQETASRLLVFLSRNLILNMVTEIPLNNCRILSFCISVYIYLKTSLLVDMQSQRGWLLFNIQLFVSDVRRFFGSDKLYVRLRGWDLSRWNTVAPCRVFIWMVAGTCAQTQIVPWP